MMSYIIYNDICRILFDGNLIINLVAYVRFSVISTEIENSFDKTKDGIPKQIVFSNRSKNYKFVVTTKLR
jgi:hypothetical protein